MKRLMLSVLVLVAFSASAACSATRYVDPAGNDANPCTQASPCATIQRGHDAASSGDTVSVANGTYTESVDVTTSNLTFYGGSGVVMLPPNPGASDEGFDIKANVSGITIKNDFEITGDYGEPIFVRAGASNIDIIDVDIHGNQVGIRISGADDVKIKDGFVHGNENGITMDSSANNVRIDNMVIWGNDDGLGCDGDADGISADDTVSNLQVTNSLIFNNSEDGIDSQGFRTRITAVEVYGNCRGVRLWDTKSYLKNSLIYDNTNVGVTLTMLFGPVNGKIDLYNNTIDNPVRGILSGADKAWRLTLKNNIVTSTGKVVEVADCMTVKENFNIFDRSNANADHFNIVAGCGSGASTVRYSGVDIEDGTYQAATGNGANTRAVDPLYVNAGSDYHLDSASVGVDNGTDEAGVPGDDLDGVTRPQGSAVDMGAYEQ